MADAEAADGWPDMEFEDDTLDVENDVVESMDATVQEGPELPLQLDSEVSNEKEETVVEEIAEPAEEIYTMKSMEKAKDFLMEKEPEGEPQAVPSVEDVEPVADTPSQTMENVKQITNDLPAPTQNGHADQADTIAKLQAQLEAMQLQIDQKDEQLNTLQSKCAVQDNNNESIKMMELRLEEVESERDDAKQQLEDFLSKVSSMKNVVRNYKAAQEELEEVKEQLAQVTNEKDDVDEELASFKEKYNGKEAEIISLSETIARFKTETSDLNSECDRLSQQLAILRREFQEKDDSFQDEKYSLENELGRLAKKISEHKTEYNELELAKEEIVMENKNLVLVVEELKGKVDSKDAEVSQYVKMVDEITAKSENSIEELNAQVESQRAEHANVIELLQQVQSEVRSLTQANEQKQETIAKLQEETSKLAELKEEVHSKQLIIGKLRHEAIILNEHLTKSLSMLKQQLSNTDNTVDRELISNVFLNFLQIPRGDTKKFEALLLISALLDWDEPRKVQAGLSHNFSKGKDTEGRPFRQSFVSLWTDFLEKESSNKAPN